MSACFKKKATQICLFLAVLVAALAIVGCGKEDLDPTGGETHFLRLCDAEGDSCGDLSCLCGVCSVTCSEDEACSGFASSECVENSAAACEQGETVNRCEAICDEDQDCFLLSDFHRCVRGSCRLAEDGTAPEITDCSDSSIPANEVVVIGDAFLASSHEITAFLEDLARSEGVLQAGERYRDYSRQTQNALALSEPRLLDQYEMALAEAPVQVVIMNGGGADVLLGDCEELTVECPLIAEAVLAFEELLGHMADDGVQDVVFLGYPDPQPSEVQQRMALLLPVLEDRCEQSPVPCHWVDLRPVFEDNYDEYLQESGLNPTTEGSRASAVAAWEVMVAGCIGQ